MSRAKRSFSFINAVLSCVLVCSPLSSGAEDGQGSAYPVSGKVLSISLKGAHSYQIETDSKIYSLMCEKVKGLHLGLPECKIGDKPIALGDTLQLRVDGDWVYAPGAKGSEEGLRILTSELKTIPPLPQLPDSAKGPAPGTNRGVVIGTGMHISGQKVGWSTNPSAFGAGVPAPGFAMATPTSPVIASGPVMAIPATGGTPVMVTPIGPTGGGMVTGVPTTGGAPIMGMATGPVMGTRIGGAPLTGAGMVVGGGPHWVHLLRIASAGKAYQLECSAKPCEVDKKNLELGDTLVIRIEKKWAYVSSVIDPTVKEQKFRILGETDDPAPSDPKSAPDPK